MNKKIIYLIVAVVVAGGITFFLLRGSPQSTPAAPVQPPPQATVPSAAPTIVKAVMSRSVDAQGRATGETNAFSAKTDKIVYAILTLQNVLKTTKLSYVRYLNDKYIDSKVAQPSKNGTASFYFTFEKGIGAYPTGIYKLNFYVNGKRATSVTYTFK